jgi:alpha-galactosidase/6-phospho-beta-glucosidase family protein
VKAVFIGGGAHRLFPILRSALAEPGIFDDGEINLYDLDHRRAQVMGELLKRTPEYRARKARIVWGTSLDEALEGASVVGVVLMAGSPLSFALGNAACFKAGFIGSDNVSPNGAFLGIKTAPILLDIARRMERLCPDAWLADFANPVAVMSAMINRHTRIQALGICGGFTNHCWDLNRVLYGRDECGDAFRVEPAGVNHLSFIVRGSVGAKDLFAELDAMLKGDWTLPSLDALRNSEQRQNITRSITNLVRFYRDLGVLIFSTEPDGMAHLYHDEYVAQRARAFDFSRSGIEARLKADAAARSGANRAFEAHLDGGLDDAFWKELEPKSPLNRVSDDIFLRVLRGASGVAPTSLVTSRLNQGAVEGLPNDVAVEYAQVLFRKEIKPEGSCRVPSVVHGLIDSLAVHQTMLADACATEDPRLLAHALLAYPVRPYARETRALYRELIEINRNEGAPFLSKTIDYLK